MLYLLYNHYIIAKYFVTKAFSGAQRAAPTEAWC